MAPATARFNPNHLSNPFAHLNQPHAMNQNAHHANQTLPQNMSSHFAAAGNLHGGISPFAPSSGNMGLPGGYGAGGGGGTGLASDAAVRGFEHGAALQRAQAHQAEAAQQGNKAGASGGRIREVWRHNLESEMKTLRALVDRYPYISMDTEFPGIVARPMGSFPTKADYHYQTLRCNVDLLKLIQLGITVFTADGDTPPAQPDASLHQQRPSAYLPPLPCTWSFNFQFSLDTDMYAESSVEILKKAGVDFDKHREQGIDVDAFGSLLITSGLTLDDDVHWLSFHSGYDFGYLVKIMSATPLPASEEQFRTLVKIYFPHLWDIKFLLRHAQKLAQRGTITTQAATILASLGQKSGLQDLANELECTRVGAMHTAGSDSWLTGSVFWALRAKIFDNDIPADLADQIYGLHGVGPPASAATREQLVLANGGGGGGSSAGGLGGGGSSTGGYATSMTPTTHTSREGGPSTPTTGHAGLVGQTVGQHGGGGGVFGNFSYK
ncbi:ribonuclease H-like domain-containing protein [Cryomyces antarcticus]